MFLRKKKCMYIQFFKPDLESQEKKNVNKCKIRPVIQKV